MNTIVISFLCLFVLVTLSLEQGDEKCSQNKRCYRNSVTPRRNYDFYPDTYVPELNGDYSQGVTFRGLLTPNCVRNYQRIFVTRRVPPRNYQYYHETLNSETIGEEQDYYQNLFRWRIVGGKLASIEDIPYQVLYGKYCGGSLIAPDWVITAAHCKDKEKFIYAGSTYRDETTPYKICSHFIHPLWNKTKNHSHDYDYQLVLLETPVPVTPHSRPIAIGSLDDIQSGRTVGISGWGHLEYKKSKMQDHLRRVFVPIMEEALCKTMPGGNYDKITPRMFCAGLLNGTKDSCQGDSGGPVVYNSKLIGLVSFGVGCASPHHPGVYTNIPMGRQWIRAVTSLPL